MSVTTTLICDTAIDAGSVCDVLSEVLGVNSVVSNRQDDTATVSMFNEADPGHPHQIAVINTADGSMLRTDAGTAGLNALRTVANRFGGTLTNSGWSENQTESFSASNFSL